MGVLDDKVAIVTGSARGIGRATADLLAEHGAKVVINDLDKDAAEEAAGQIQRETAKAEKAEGREVFRKIVNVSSTSGMNGNADQANYSAGKLGIVGLTKTLAKEWGQFKVNCNAVAFGFIETRLTAAKADENVMEIDGEKVQLGIPEQLRGMGAMLIPLGRPGTPEEAAGGIFLLCTPWANYIHGQVINVTGGQFTGMYF